MKKIFLTFFILFFFTFYKPNKPFKELKVIFNCELEQNATSLKKEKKDVHKFITWLMDIKNSMKYSKSDILTFFVSQMTIEDIKKDNNIDTSLIDVVIVKSSEEEKAFNFFEDNFIQTEKEIDDLEKEIFFS